MFETVRLDEAARSSVAQHLQVAQSGLHSIKQSARRIALAALNDDQTSIDQLPSCSGTLAQALLHYIELEHALILPLLVQTSDRGATRAEMLRERHRRGRQQIHMAHLASRDLDTKQLVTAVLSMCEL